MKGKNTMKLVMACSGVHVQLAYANRCRERSCHLFYGVFLPALS
jgi:hypothetical protein